MSYLGLVRLLAKERETSFSKLMDEVGMSKSALSNALRSLDQYIEKRREGKSVILSIKPCFSPIYAFPHQGFLEGQDHLLCSLTNSLSSKIIQIRGNGVIGKEAVVATIAVYLLKEKGEKSAFLTPTILSRENLLKELVSSLETAGIQREEYLIVDAFAIQDACPLIKRMQTLGWSRAEVSTPHLCRSIGFKAKEEKRKCPFSMGEAVRAAEELAGELRGAWGIDRYRFPIQNLVEFASSRAICPYFLMMKAMEKADFIVTDFNHLVLARKSLMRRNIFVNEADLLPWRLYELATLSLRERDLEVDAPSYVSEILEAVRGVMRKYAVKIDPKYFPPGAVVDEEDIGEIQELLSKLVKAVDEWSEELVKEWKEPATPIHNIVNRMFAIPLSRNLVVSVEEDKEGLSLKIGPKHPGYLISDFLSGEGRVIFYSATLPKRYPTFWGVSEYADIEGRVAGERLDIIAPLQPLTYKREKDVIESYKEFLKALGDYKPLIAVATRRIAKLVLPPGFRPLERPEKKDEYGKILEEILGEPLLTLSPHGFASRGEDLTLERPLVAVVSIPMPPPSPIREARRKSYVEKVGEAEAWRTYYLDVGIVAAVQAVRRFNRDPKGKLAVVWIDRRWGSSYALEIIMSTHTLVSSEASHIVEAVRSYYGVRE